MVRSIGVLIDKHASMELHVTSVCKSAQYHLHNIGRISTYLSRESTEQLIRALITSKLLQRIQYIAERIVTQSRKSHHITPVLHDLHWLPVAQTIKFKVLLFVFKCQNNMVPFYLHDLVKPQEQVRTLRSSDQHCVLLCTCYSHSKLKL